MKKKRRNEEKKERGGSRRGKQREKRGVECGRGGLGELCWWEKERRGNLG